MRKRNTLSLLILLIAICSFSYKAQANILNVPDDFETIQAGIDAADKGDTVLIAQGVYFENIEISAQSITVMGDWYRPEHVFINGNQDGGSVVTIFNSLDRDIELRGLILAGGHAEFGGGIYCHDASPRIVGVKITNNSADENGGGLYCFGESHPELDHVEITGNVAEQGGGVFCGQGTSATLQMCEVSNNRSYTAGGGLMCSGNNSSVLLINSTISSNETEGRGGGIMLTSEDAVANATIFRCEIRDNYASDDGGGIFAETASINCEKTCIARNISHGNGTAMSIIRHSNINTINCTIANNSGFNDAYCVAAGWDVSFVLTNSILWGNGRNRISLQNYHQPSTLSISYSDIEGGIDGVLVTGDNTLLWLLGNRNTDPLFVNARCGDYHLTTDSPCRDSGDPRDELDPDGTRIDMGAFSFFSHNGGACLHVPADFPTIQAAIDEAEDSDFVLVEPWEYLENIKFYDKEITVIGDTLHPENVVINGMLNQEPVVTFEDNEGESPILCGFTIKGGYTNWGGGIYCCNTNPILHHLIITENMSIRNGGGIHCTANSEVNISDVVIKDNVSRFAGGGISCFSGSQVSMDKCLLVRNNGTLWGGAIQVYRENSCLYITNSKKSENTASSGAVIYIGYGEEIHVSMIDVLINDHNYYKQMISAAAGELSMERVICVNNQANHEYTSLLSIINDNTVIRNCVFCSNYYHGGEEDPLTTISITLEGNVSIFNSVLYNPGATELKLIEVEHNRSECTIGYNNILGGEENVRLIGDPILNWLEGNIDEDPLFADPENGDYHLTADSPCIDHGDPDDDLDPDGTRADIGAYYFHQRDIDLDLNELVFEPLIPGELDSLCVAISNIGGNTLTIERMRLVNNLHNFRVRENDGFEIPAYSTYPVWVFFDPDQLGEFEAFLNIESDDPDEPLIEIPVRGVSSGVGEPDNLPVIFSLSPPYPNPFNAVTRLTYSLPTTGRVDLSIFDINGREIATLFSGEQVAGTHSVNWNAEGAPSGVYFCRLTTTTQSHCQKVVLVK